MTCICPKTMNISSDHSLLMFDFHLTMSSSGCNKRTVFDFKRADWNGLQNKLRFSNLSPTDHSNLDLDADWEKWKNTFLSTAADHIPRKSLNKNSSLPWFDGEIKHLINKKDFCRKRAKQSLNPSAWEKFRTLRRQVKSLLHDKRKEFSQNLPDLLKTSSKSFGPFLSQSPNIRTYQTKFLGLKILQRISLLTTLRTLQMYSTVIFSRSLTLPNATIHIVTSTEKTIIPSTHFRISLLRQRKFTNVSAH